MMRFYASPLLEVVESYCLSNGKDAVDWRTGNRNRSLTDIILGLAPHGLRCVPHFYVVQTLLRKLFRLIGPNSAQREAREGKDDVSQKSTGLLGLQRNGAMSLRYFLVDATRKFLYKKDMSYFEGLEAD